MGATRRIALAAGDPNGIGPEITVKAAAAAGAGCALTVYGPAEVLRRTADQLGLSHVWDHVRLQPTRALAQHRPGVVDPEAGLCTVDAAAQAIDAALTGEVDAVLAAPHHEQAIAQAGVAFSGYPGLVAQRAGVGADDVFMMLDGAGLRIVHVTLHESVLSAIARISTQRVERAIRAGVHAMRQMGMVTPRVAVFGVNPHASEGGLWGTEDESIVRPAVQTLRAEGHAVDGPGGADVLLAARAHDLYVAMLHDQGHIPIKLLAPQAATAWTLCDGVVFASVAHGSAMDIAGQGVARADALLRSLRAVSPPHNEEAPSP